MHGENEGQMHFVQGEKIFRVCCQATQVTLNKRPGKLNDSIVLRSQKDITRLETKQNEQELVSFKSMNFICSILPGCDLVGWCMAPGWLVSE